MDEPSSFESLNERLPISTKIYYGIGYVPVYCNLALLSLFHSPFLLEVAQISPFYVGSLLIIGQIWDALIDPVIGYLSDKTRTKWGRRRPWMFVGSLTLGTSFCSLWQVFRIEDEFGRWIYYTVTFLLFKTFMTLFAVPYGAMLPELTPNYNERTNLVTYKVMIAYSITLLLGFGQARLLAQLAHPRISYIIGSIISSLVFTGSALITTLCLRETPIKELELKKIQNEKEGEFVNDNENNDNTNIIGDEEESRSRLKEVVLEVWCCLRNRSFMALVGVSLFCWVASQTTATVLQLYLRYVVRNPKGFQWVFLIIISSSLISIPFWSAFARRFGKKSTFAVGKSVSVIVLFCLFFVGGSSPVWTFYLVFFLIGLFGPCRVSVTVLIPWSMLPDVIEQDVLETGLRREGIYYALFVMLQKLSVAVSSSSTNFALGAAGYVSPDSPEFNGQQP
eukprot:TRINITY_DN904_c0_g1_i8.p1 TRINITY_DN904_c0_g1~~TRINITY_DN904_c0_g1_i8.p1  ORF type:complete len:450 (+),score=70.93 TRINITY_DN904_c0_g1_i8:42-1391(+)